MKLAAAVAGMANAPFALTAAEQRRWYPLIDHPVQRALVTDAVRFKVVPAGRRSGKTERAKRYIVRAAMSTPLPYFVAAPTRDQVKRIYWDDLKLLSFSQSMRGFGMRVSESELTIRWPHGGSIVLIGLDQPARIEGSVWGGGVVDEVADSKPEAWPENISPALDTMHPSNPDYRAWCWLIGVPEGLNHYYDMAEKARLGQDPDWKLYHWKSSDILPPDVIAAARRRMSMRQYRQEYEASFETAAGRLYEDYAAGNQRLVEAASHEQLHWFHDFNFSPLSSGIAVRRGNDVYCVAEIVLQSAVARQSALEFVERFKAHENRTVLLYGDPAGRAGEKHGHASDYNEMESVLRAHAWTVQRRVRPAAPAIRDRQNAVRAKIANASGQRSLFVNPATCQYIHRGLSTVAAKQGSTFLEEITEYQHITTALGYFVEFEWPVRRDPDPAETLAEPPQGSRNFWNKNDRR